MKVSILGTEYDVLTKTEDECSELKSADGYCAYFDKKIYIRDLHNDKEWKTANDNEIDNRIHHIIRHELIHAFLYESGLFNGCLLNNPWPLNEEIVDWMAIQMPKIMQVYDTIINATIRD